MEPKIPDWITSDFLCQSLQYDDRYKDITVTNFTASFAAPPGNNYGSLVIRVVVDCKLRGDDHKLSVIVKGPVTEGATGELMKEFKNSEPLFYYVFLPEVKKLMEYNFTPKTYHSQNSLLVIMEDLKEGGYMMANRFKQLDFDHCCLYMKAAAAFHAASAALYKQNPDMINSVCGENFYSEESKARPLTENMNKWAIQCLAKHISDKEIVKIILDSAKYISRMLTDLHRPNYSLNSLLQGDPWTTKMMFKYDSAGNVCEIKLIDFQNLLLGSPVHDLVFFIWFSANDDVRKHRLRDIYSHYFTQLNMNLQKLNQQEVEFDCFMEIVRMFSPLALVTVATSAFVLHPSPGDFNDIVAKGMSDNAADAVNPFERYYTEQFCQTRLSQLVDNLVAEGVFDYLKTKLKTMQEGSS